MFTQLTKKVTILLLTTFCSLSLLSQKIASNKTVSLNIGDKVPARLWETFTKGDTNRVYILDFFATSCGACIGGLPKLSKLQNEFKSSLKISLITYQSKEELQKLRERNKLFASHSFPTVFDDSVFLNLFPHRLLPHVVWVQGNGTVIAISASKYVTSEFLQQAINHRSIDIPTKIDDMAFDRYNSIDLSDDNTNSTLCKSLIKGGHVGAPSTTTVSYINDSSIKRIAYVNDELPNLYAQALGIPYSNRWLLRIDSTHLKEVNPITKINERRFYCYEISMPVARSKEFKKWMLEDLNRFFQLRSYKEKRNVSCFALIRINNDQLVESKGGTPKSTLFFKDSSHKVLQNQPIKKFVDVLNFQRLGTIPRAIILDETNFTNNVDLDLNILDLWDFKLLNQELSKYGLKIIEVQRTVDFLVVESTTSV